MYPCVHEYSIQTTFLTRNCPGLIHWRQEDVHASLEVQLWTSFVNVMWRIRYNRVHPCESHSATANRIQKAFKSVCIYTQPAGHQRTKGTTEGIKNEAINRSDPRMKWKLPQQKYRNMQKALKFQSSAETCGQLHALPIGVVDVRENRRYLHTTAYLRRLSLHSYREEEPTNIRLHLRVFAYAPTNYTNKRWLWTKTFVSWQMFEM